MINKESFYVSVRKSFGKLNSSQIEGFEAIIDEFEAQKIKDARHLAYMLATVWHECATLMRPIEEWGRGHSKPYGKKIKFNSKAYAEPNQLYYGRGFVQLTWFENYEKIGNILGIDLLKAPALALDLKIATKIMFVGMEFGIFTGKRLSDYFNDKEDNPIGARKIINGLDKANLISGYYQEFLNAIK